MRIQTILTEIIKEKGLKKAEFARRLGILPQTLHSRLTQEGIGIYCTAEMAKALNYRVVLVPDTAKLPAGSYEVTLE